MLLFSATYDADVMAFAEKVIPRDPVVIKLRREEESLDNIRQYYIECENQESKFQALSNIYSAISIGQSMIFCAVCFFFQNGLIHFYKCRTHIDRLCFAGPKSRSKLILLLGLAGFARIAKRKTNQEKKNCGPAGIRTSDLLR